MSESLRISLGSLNSVAALYHSLSKELKIFSNYYREGIQCEIVWDFRALEKNSINTAALTSFLSISKRLRKFSRQPQKALVEWNPSVFTFLHDILFFDVCKENDLIIFPADIVGGFETNVGNPNTRILMIDYDVAPEKENGLDQWREWKDRKRHEIKSIIVKRCVNLFDGGDLSGTSLKETKDIISKTCAELALNSIMWGKEDAFIGLQRSSKGITVCVADSGIGFMKSIARKNIEFTKNILDTAEALIYSSIVNSEDYGLKRAIDSVIKNNGWILMSSEEAELVWSKDYWEEINNNYDYISNINLLRNYKDRFVKNSRSIVYFEKRRSGYCRLWAHPIKGSRVSFEIPLQRHK